MLLSNFISLGLIQAAKQIILEIGNSPSTRVVSHFLVIEPHYLANPNSDYSDKGLKAIITERQYAQLLSYIAALSANRGIDSDQAIERLCSWNRVENLKSLKVKDYWNALKFLKNNS